ncbi:MotA/TolQ/ExbB proton channel family protein [Rubritalea marina]|uniref:MotA/TolQ/ExbB proton channel family protein n=1 Tax=Rubritalea marina TaxID=361055 RepID=UPI0003705625|nr:MotA/TolQ/ExbB proton channel family protein [Rubritalea marina]
MNTHSILAAEATMFEKLADFYEKGGIIMLVLTGCSILTVAVIIYKLLDLSKSRVMPEQLAKDIDVATLNPSEQAMLDVASSSRDEKSVLARLTQIVVKHKDRSPAAVRDAVQSRAREEIVKMQSGIGTLDVVIVVAPMLGLLGTASGITTVFDGMSSLGDIKMSIMAQGVAEALTTTIAGLAVAVPAVIGHSYFNRKIETYASRLEVVVGNMVHVLLPEDGEKD